MEISLKKVVAIAIAGVSGLGAMGASADVVNIDSGNGELTLFVRNETTGAVYARGLQVQLDSILTQGAIQSGQYNAGVANQRSYLLPDIGPDANLASFLGQAGSFTWTIMAGDSTGTAATVGARRYVTSSQVDLTNGTTVTNGNFQASYTNLRSVLETLNGILADTSGSSTASNGQWRQSDATPGSQAGDWFGVGPDNVNALGSIANFYMLANNAGGGAVRVYQFEDVRLNLDGSLESVPTVPLPAAFWLLGTGLAGLAGVSRRRKSA
ncbi:MAG: VPLPA-CTERM sorting domain-containing protein [Steroidobacter sp.]